MIGELGDDQHSGEDETKTRVPEHTGFVLRVAAPGSVTSFAIPAAGQVCLGRGMNADIRIPMPDMSRRHAMLAWDRGVLRITDLGSSNGTTVRGERLGADQSAPLAIREPFFVADAALVVHEGAPTDGPRRIVGAEPFEGALKIQLTAYTRTKRPFGVLAVDVDSDSAWSDLVVALLAKNDVVGFLSENMIRAILVDRTPEQLEVLVQFLQKALVQLSTSRKVALRACPRDGETLQALYAVRERPKEASARSETRRPSAPVVRSQAMTKVYQLVEEIARTPTSILVLGETGVGKDVLARAIHSMSDRFAAPMVGLNCAALPESLLESELFGYERGAFTGAVAPKQGLIESAEGGTVFLDEVGEMPLSTQAKLLRVLEERKVMRLGGLKPKSVNFRLLAATNRNLQVEIAAGRFRADLFYRINGFTVTIPPLRERRDEIVALAMHFAERAAHTLGKPLPLVASETLSCLERYAWPGNIRELRSVIERAVLLARGGAVLPEHLPDEVISTAASLAPLEDEPTTATQLPSLRDEDDDDTEVGSPPPRSVRAVIFPNARKDEAPPSSVRGGASSLKEEVERLEYERIVTALQEYGGNQTRAAQSLGMTRRALIIRLERFGLPRPRKNRD